ncbi:glycosyltransferase family 2 protein [Arenimonas alkanexedens]
MSVPKLSICIATYNRCDFIGETLASLLPQLVDAVEVLVLDGASPDRTAEVVKSVADANPSLRYVRESTNSGVDQDYDKAVAAARGEYCWLMTDDDLLRPGAVARVLAALDGQVDLVVVNSEVRTVDFGRVLQTRLLDFEEDRNYAAGEHVAFFEQVAPYLKFIGAVVIRRAAWLARKREPYYGTLFVHVGVIFQSPPLAAVRVIADPLIVIRYGNAMWTPRGFEIWMFKWPGLVWSFDGYGDASKARVSARQPWRQLSKLGAHRGLGAYSITEYRRLLAQARPAHARLIAWSIARLPAGLANSLAGLACLTMPRKSRLNLYDLSRGPHATLVTRLVARLMAV